MKINPEQLTASPADMFNVLLIPVTDQLIHLVISLDGRIDTDLLKKAVSLSMDAVKIAGCRFVEDGDTAYWKQIPVTEVDAVAPVIISTNPADDLNRCLAEPIDVMKGPQVRVATLRAETDTIIITAHHAAMDACGVKEFASLICATYRHFSDDPYFRPQMISGQKREFSPVFASFSEDELKTAGLRYKQQVQAWSFPSTSRGAINRKFARREIQPEQFRAIKNYGHQIGATINDIALTAFYLALIEYTEREPKTPLPILTSADLRKYLPGEHRHIFANYSVAFEVFINSSPGEETGDVIHRVSETMKEHKSKHTAIGSALSTEELFSSGYAEAKKWADSEINMNRKTELKNPMFSNTGIISEEQINFGSPATEDAYIIAPVAFPPAFLVTLSTFRDRMFLTTNSRADEATQAGIEKFLDLVVSKMLLQ